MNNFLFILILLVQTQLFAQALVFPPYKHSYGIRKATPKHLFVFFGPRTFFDNPQGICTAKMESRDDPGTESDDDEVVVYGVNSGRCQLIYNTSMWSLGLYGKKGNGVGEFLYPTGITCDVHGNVYVVDQGNNRIVHLFNPKRKVKWVNSFFKVSSSTDTLKSPSQIAIDENGRLYVTDSGNYRIVVYDSIGTFLQSFPKPNHNYIFKDNITTIAVGDGSNPWSYFRGEKVIFCVDSGGTRIRKIDFNGNLLKTAYMPSGHFADYGATDYYHNFWVTDKKNSCIVKFNHNLELLTIFGSKGKRDNQFIEPRGIAIWKRYGQVFISEKSGAQYYWVGTDLKDSKVICDTTKSKCKLIMNLSEYSYISLLRVANGDTFKVFDKRMVHPLNSSILFERSLIRGYEDNLTLLVEPTYSSYTYFKKYYHLEVH